MRKALMAALVSITLVAIAPDESPAQTQTERSTRSLLSAVGGMGSYLGVEPLPEARMSTGGSI
jgi:hypothetical protein